MIVEESVDPDGTALIYMYSWGVDGGDALIYEDSVSAFKTEPGQTWTCGVEAVSQGLHSEQATAFIHDEISRTFDEDLAILELQQKAIVQFNHPASVDILADAGGVQSRRLLRGLIENEHATESGSRIQQAELAN